MCSRKVLFYGGLALLLCCSTDLLYSQDRQAELKKGVTVSASLKTGEKHRYTLSINANQFAFFRLVQKGIDLAITTYDPEGNKIQDFDSPNWRNGDEPVSLFTDKKGNYLLEITSLDKEGHQGNYTITWEKLEPRATTPEEQVDQLFAEWTKPGSPGAVVGVAMDGKIIFNKGYGSAEPEYDIPITSETVFHIASLSKQFTAFAILMLENEGKLSIRDDIRKYIPEVPDFGRVITLDHLLHHTSGLRDQWELLAMAGWRLDDNITTAQILRLVSRQQELNFSPGDEMLYCNTGYTLLAEVVARVSGMSFADFTRTRIFEPLQMSHTLFYDDCEKLVRNRAYSFYYDSTGLRKSNLNYSTVGATSLFTTAGDLCRWAMNFETPVIGKEIIGKMAERGILNNGDTLGYAMGQGVGVYKGLKMFAHSGADAGYRTALFRFPDQHFSVNVLSNLASFDPGGMALKITDIYLKDKEVNNPSKSPETKDVGSSDTSAVIVDHDLLLSYCGKYELQPGFVATITLESDKLMAEAPGLSKTPMTPLSAAEFLVKEVPARVLFMKDDQGKVIKMSVNMNGQQTMANRIPDFDPAGVDLSELTGNYYSPELKTTYRFVVESGKLIARHFRTGDVVLTPVKPDIFSGNQWYFGYVQIVRDANNQVTGCKVGNGRVKNLQFEKTKNENL